MVAVRAKVGSRSYVRQKALAKGKKVFKIDCSVPANDGIFDDSVIAAFEQYFQDNTKLNGLKGKLTEKVRINMNKDNVLTVTTTMAYRKKYFKYLTKKFLKKKDLRDWIRILSTSKDTYQLKYFNIQGEDEE